MSAEAIAIAGVGVALLAVLVPLLVSIRGDVRDPTRRNQRHPPRPARPGGKSGAH